MSDRILGRFFRSAPQGWNRVAIGRCLEEISKPIQMQDSEEYRLVSIRRRNGGMTYRATLHGRDILTKTLQEVAPHSFVIARMQVVHGATALAPAEFSGAAISKSYSSFIGTEICDIGFFSWLAKHPLMYAYFMDSSHGVVIEKMTFDQARWLSRPIFLPPIAEQRRIAEALDAADEAILATGRLLGKLEQARQGLLHDLLIRGIGESGHLRPPDLLRWTVLGLVPEAWAVGPLGGFLTSIDAGRSPDLPDRPAKAGEWGVLKVSAIRPDGLQEGENKVVTRPSLIDPSIEVKSGDLLISRANTLELVGLACYVRAPRPGLMLSDKTLRLNIDSKVAVPEFIGYLLGAPSSRRQMETNGTGSSGSMKNISQDEIRSLVLPLPGLQEQYRILVGLDSNRMRLDVMRRELSKLRLLKGGLVDDLLTGRVRVGASG